MDKIRAVIADDEPLARRGIRQLLAPHANVEIVAEARNGRDAVRALRELKPDLLFLDVQMPVLDGFGVVDTVGAKNMPAVIFVTAYDEFAVKAFEAHALDYLVKPLEETRFRDALERVYERARSAEAVNLSHKLSAMLQMREQEHERARQRLLVPTPSGDLLLDVAEIDWIEADDYYAAIHVGTGRHLIRESLASLESRLDEKRFVRVHRSAIVCIDHIRKLRKQAGETFVVLHNGVQVPVSRRRRSQVTRLLRDLK
jgi:two-component system LytT family response regulator